MVVSVAAVVALTTAIFVALATDYCVFFQKSFWAQLRVFKIRKACIDTARITFVIRGE